MSHSAHIFHSLEEYIAYNLSYIVDGIVKEETDEKKRERIIRKSKMRWKKHIDKHGNVPMIIKCSVCSGTEFKHDVKVGKYSVSRPNKAERDEMKDIE